MIACVYCTCLKINKNAQSLPPPWSVKYDFLSRFYNFRDKVGLGLSIIAGWDKFMCKSVRLKFLECDI